MDRHLVDHSQQGLRPNVPDGVNEEMRAGQFIPALIAAACSSMFNGYSIVSSAVSCATEIRLWIWDAPRI